MRWILRHRPSPVTLLALAVLGVMLMAQLAGAMHPRPKGATPLRASLVPAYKQCTAPNRTHGPPLGFPSCSPPVQTSNFLTVGSPDANGAGANSVGSSVVSVTNSSPREVRISLSISDVRCKPGTAASVCSGANAADGPDYSGELEFLATARVSDHYNGPNVDEPATMVDIPVPGTFLCSNTADTSIGGLCNALPPPCLGCFPPPDGQRAVIELTQIQVFDGGADGRAATDDNTLFAVQGVFIP
jgi:hypothetical protein